MVTRYVIACEEGYLDSYDGFSQDMSEAKKFTEKSGKQRLEQVKKEHKFKLKLYKVEAEKMYGEFKVVGRSKPKFRNIEEGDFVPSHFDDGTKFDPEYLFRRLNEKCKGCTQSCKQSAKAIIIQCKQYQSVNAAEKNL